MRSALLLKIYKISKLEISFSCSTWLPIEVVATLFARLSHDNYNKTIFDL